MNISTVIPSVSEQQAVNEALNYVNAQKYKWEDLNLEKFIKQNTNNPNATYYPKGELVITKDLLKGGNNLRLAWKFTISSLIPNNEQLIYVDANTGEAIRNTPLVYDVNTPCTALLVVCCKFRVWTSTPFLFTVKTPLTIYFNCSNLAFEIVRITIK